MQHIQKYVVGLCVMLVRMYVKMCYGVIGRMKYEMVKVWLYFVYMKKKDSLIQKVDAVLHLCNMALLNVRDI